MTRRRGREGSLPQPRPDRQVRDRWVSKFSEPWAAGLGELKQSLERSRTMETHVFEIYIKTTRAPLARRSPTLRNGPNTRSG